jgi:hypothetical protein
LYPNWDTYAAAEFPQGMLVVPRENRPTVVRSLMLKGLGARPIAAALGVSRETVRRAAQGDTNVSPPKPKPIPKPDRYLQQCSGAFGKIIEGAIEADRLCRDRRFVLHHDALVKDQRDNMLWAHELLLKLVPHFDDPDVILLDEDDAP